MGVPGGEKGGWEVWHPHELAVDLSEQLVQEGLLGDAADQVVPDMASLPRFGAQALCSVHCGVQDGLGRKHNRKGGREA